MPHLLYVHQNQSLDDSNIEKKKKKKKKKENATPCNASGAVQNAKEV
jgi:hypothetical protein